MSPCSPPYPQPPYTFPHKTFYMKAFSPMFVCPCELIVIHGISNFYRGSRLKLRECSKRETVGRLHQLVVNAYWGCKAPMERKTKYLKQGKCAAPEEGDEETFRSLPPCLPALENSRNLIPLFLHADTFSQPNNPASLVPPALASLEWCRGWGWGVGCCLSGVPRKVKPLCESWGFTSFPHQLCQSCLTLKYKTYNLHLDTYLTIWTPILLCML